MEDGEDDHVTLCLFISVVIIIILITQHHIILVLSMIIPIVVLICCSLCTIYNCIIRMLIYRNNISDIQIEEYIEEETIDLPAHNIDTIIVIQNPDTISLGFEINDSSDI